MDAQALAAITSTIGVPAMICIYMLRYVEKSEERHAAEMRELRKVVRDNTVAVVRLCEKLDKNEDVEK